MIEKLKPLYNAYLRDRLPRTWAVYAGVAHKDARLLDMTLEEPDYKHGLITAIDDHVNGQTVTLVGYGRGVSTVRCLRAGARHVTAYEASEEMVKIANQTVKVNTPRLTDRVTAHHCTVGEPVEVYGQPSPTRIEADELKHSGVLVMDCEGAERSILRGMVKRPETVIVETHPERGVPTQVTNCLLRGLGYDVCSYGACESSKDVLVGELQ